MGAKGVCDNQPYYGSLRQLSEILKAMSSIPWSLGNSARIATRRASRRCAQLREALAGRVWPYGAMGEVPRKFVMVYGQRQGKK